MPRFDDLRIRNQRDQRDLRKPLLVLHALGTWQHGRRQLTIRRIEPDLTALLREIGPVRKSDCPT